MKLSDFSFILAPSAIAADLPFGTEHPVIFDKEPIATRLPFRYNSDTILRGEKAMNRTELVTHIIQHSEDFPDTEEITLESAQTILENLDQEYLQEDLTAEEFMQTWNQLIHDPSVMDID